MTRFKEGRATQQLPSRARRVSTSAPRRAVHLDSELPLLRGWSTGRKLAEGAQARIFLVHRAGDPQRLPFAAKVLRLSTPDGWPYSVTEQTWRLLREVTILSLLAERGCQSVPRVIEHGLETDRSEEPWYVMPYYEGGTMWRLAGSEAGWAEAYRGEIDRVLGIAQGLAETLTVMHEMKPECIHRDVNASNVLFATRGGPPILADFGIACLKGYPEGPLKAGGSDSTAGVRSAPWRWRPPELGEADAEATPAADVFMLGGLIVEALSGGRDLPDRAYWPSAELPERSEHLLSQHTNDPRVDAVMGLVGRMLSSDPRHRPAARTVGLTCQEIRRPPANASRRRLMSEAG